MKTDYCVVFVTSPAGPVAKKLAHLILKARLAACVNIVASVKSLYWWKNKIHNDKESLLIIKTRKVLVSKLTLFIEKNHPYESPEVISLPIEAGRTAYLKWIHENT